MIAADTSTWIAFLEGETATDTELLDQALRDRRLLMVPVVLTELLSDPKLPVQVARTLCDVPAIQTGSEYWQRAGALRAKVLAKRRRARLGDALIAQSCIDGGISLLTPDRDIRAFTEAAGLKLIVEHNGKVYQEQAPFCRAVTSAACFVSDNWTSAYGQDRLVAVQYPLETKRRVLLPVDQREIKVA